MFLDTDGFLWSFASIDKQNGKEKLHYCLNKYAYDTSKDGFLGEGSFFRAYRAKMLEEELTNDDFESNFYHYSEENKQQWVTLRIGLISCLKGQKLPIRRANQTDQNDTSEFGSLDNNIMLSVYERVLLESLIMNKLNHINIAKLFGIIQVPEYNQIVLVQEYHKNQIMYWNSKNGTYSAVNNSDSIIVYSEKVSLAIFKQLLDCFEYLHNLGIVHRDIKPENIFLSGNIDSNELIHLDNESIFFDSLAFERKSESDSEPDYAYESLSEFEVKSDHKLIFGELCDELSLENREFEESCVWYDSPFFESYSQAKREIKSMLSYTQRKKGRMDYSHKEEKRHNCGSGESSKQNNYCSNNLFGRNSFLSLWDTKSTKLNSLFNPALLNELNKVDAYRAILNDDTFSSISNPEKNSNCDFCIKLSDFNSCVLIGQDHLIFDREGSMLFAPPECFRLECTTRGVDGIKRDIWSLGCLLYCLVNGRLPYYGHSEKDYLESIDNSELTFREDISGSLKDLIAGMLRKNPTERSGILEIREKIQGIRQD